MSKQSRRGWFSGARQRRPIRAATRSRPKAHLAVERFEDRSLPSSSIPLNGFTWTSIGPSPIANGQSPGGPVSTGRLNGIAFDAPVLAGQNYPFPSDPNTIYVASDTGGIWRTTDGGHNWFPETDFRGGITSTITEVNRGVNDTVYAAEGLNTGVVLFERSTDGGRSFIKTSPFPAGSLVTKIAVVALDPNDQSRDVLFASVSSFAGPGIYRSLNGGGTWSNIVNTGMMPFSSSSVEFTDVAVDPVNPDVVYAAVGNTAGDPFNGVYRTTNARAANPTWTLLIGGSALLPGSTPGGIKLAVSPVLPSTIFISAALRSDPASGAVPLLGLFRSIDSGANFTPVLIANPANQSADPRQYLGTSGADNHVLVVSPFSPQNPLQQIVYVAGFGGTNNVRVSTDSGTSFSTPGVGDLGVGADGIGPYPNVHAGQVDQQGRFLIATGGGIYRNNSIAPVMWESLNGDFGPNGLGTVQFNGFALHPTDADRALGNISNLTVQMQNALLFWDHPGAGNLAYGWRTLDSMGNPVGGTVDANGIDGNVGTGVVIYNTLIPQIIYRVTDGSTAIPPVRRSLDGGLTWAPVNTGYQAYPFGGGYYVPALAIDPSRSSRLFSGYTRVYSTDTADAATLMWRTSLQTTLTGGTIDITPLPTTQVTAQGGGPIGITALSTSRQSNVDLNGFFFNGAAIFAATEQDAARNAMGVPQNSAIPFPQLYVAVVPDLAPNQWPPAGTNYNNMYWANITPPGLAPFLFGEQIQQIVNDPSDNQVLYVYTDFGRVFRGSNFHIGYTLDMQNNIIPDPAATTITWTELTSNLPSGVLGVFRPQPMALDKDIFRTGNPNSPFADILYVGTPNGVFRLDNPKQDFTGGPPNWREVGLNPADGSRTLPNAPVTALSLNPTTGILAAATFGRGVFETQIRGLIRGRVFEDLNGNGAFEPNEPFVPGVTVRLLNLDNNLQQVASAATDANGFYEFRSVRAGNYRLTVLGNTGLFQTTTEADFLNFTEQSTFDGVNQVNFGVFRAGSISGIKFEDRNANGVRDSGEPPLAGFTIFIDRNGNGQFDAGEPMTVTAGNGTYRFDSTNVDNGPILPRGVGPDVILGDPNDPRSGPHQVREIQQVGFVMTSQPLFISLMSGEMRTGANVGNIRIGRITGTKFEDLNGDGVMELGEPPLPGFLFDLTNLSTNEVRTVASDLNGNVQFFSLAAGTYRLREQPRPGFTQTTADPPDFTLAATDQFDNAFAFGNFRNIAVTGTKFNDLNGDGVRDPGEPGLSGFSFQLINASTGAVLATTTSGANGNFIFADRGPLPGGAQYRIREVVPAGWFQTTPDPADVPVISGQNATVLFGNFRGITVSGTVYLDQNGNGVRDPGEPGALGFVIQLIRNGTVVATATTAADGSYSIPVVGPGSYQLQPRPRRGFVVTAPPNGFSFVTVSGMNLTGQDFGENRRQITLTALDAGGPPLVTVRDATTNAVKFQFNAYNPAFQGGVSVASGYVNGDTIPDIITGAGTGGGPHVRIFDGATGQEMFGFMAYEITFTGGVYVAAGDVNGDGRDDIITGTGNGGGPLVKVFSGLDGKLLTSFFPYSIQFRGGVTVGAGDMNGDGRADIATGAGPGGGPHVEVFSGSNLSLLTSVFPYDKAFTGGVFVALGDVNGDGRADLITGPGIGGGPHIKVYNGATRTQLYSFLAFENLTPGFPWVSGAHVASYDMNLNGKQDILVSPGRGQRPRVRIFEGGDLTPIADFNAADPSFLGGIFVGGG